MGEHILRHRDWTDEVRDGVLLSRSLAKCFKATSGQATEGAVGAFGLGKRCLC
jgi:hypothetical protein